MKSTRLNIPATTLASLSWCGDTLVDWVGGGRVFFLDGRCEDPRVAWGFPFDAAQATDDGRFAVVYQRYGTKALLLQDGKILRELNRSYYCAGAYEYPVCLWQRADGRPLLAHCPEAYCQIDIEDVASGERLTRGTRKRADFFHSRLAVNQAGTRILSAGWVWHPLDAVVYFDVDEALRHPLHLDSIERCAPHSRDVGLAEESSACWQTDARVLLGGSGEEDRERSEEVQGPRLLPGGIAVYDVVARAYVCSVVLGQTPGTMMPLGEEWAVRFHGHPKLVSLLSGEIVERWDDLDSGQQESSLLDRGSRHIPPLALDPRRSRFAIAGPDGITVVQFEPAPWTKESWPSLGPSGEVDPCSTNCSRTLGGHDVPEATSGGPGSSRAEGERGPRVRSRDLGDRHEPRKKVMKREDPVDIGAIMSEGTLVDLALKRAARAAIRQHQQAGLPMVDWRNGKPVWVDVTRRSKARKRPPRGPK